MAININTLYCWRDVAQKIDLSITTKYKNAKKWSSQDKFTVILETANFIRDRIFGVLKSMRYLL